MRILRFVAGLMLLLQLMQHQSLAGVIYNFEPLPGNTDGWSLDGGWIETDGTMGEIGPQNFDAWELQFTSPAGMRLITTAEYGYSFLFVAEFDDPHSEYPQSPPLVATPTQIIATPGSGRTMTLVFANQDIFSEEFSGQALVINPTPKSPIQGPSGTTCCGWLIDNSLDEENVVSPLGGYISDTSGNVGNLEVPQGSLVLASANLVPEPSSLLLAFAVLPSLMLCGAKRTRSSTS